MEKSFEDGKDLHKTLKEMQEEVLPSCDTNLVKVAYEIECLLVHDATFGSG